MATPAEILNDGATNRNSGVATGATLVDAPAGSLIVVAIGAVGTAGISTLVDSAGNTYAMKVRSNLTADIEIWFKANAVHLPVGGTFTATTSGPQYSVNVAAAVAGFNFGADSSGSNHVVTTTTMTVTSNATLGANDMAFGAINGLNGGTYTEDINWTQLSSTPATTNPLAWRQLGAKGTTSWTPSWSVAVSADGVVATFQASVFHFPQWNEGDLLRRALVPEIVSY